MKKQIVFVGGDQRTPYLAKMLNDNNFDTLLYGMEQYKTIPMDVAITHQLTSADVYILPIPITKNGSTINAPYATAPINIHEFLNHCTPNSIVFGGNFPSWFIEQAKKKSIILIDYGKSEKFAVDNAMLTAEGTIEILMNQTPYALEGKSICIVGYGRIGKILSKKLKALGCNVTVTARKREQLNDILQMECVPLETQNLASAPIFDIIVNTVPALVIDETVLTKQKRNCLIIDLASQPGGVDFELANKLGIKTIHALSLPAKYAPETAANIIANVIFKSLNETE